MVPAIVMLHGFGDNGDMWAPLAAEMAKDHTVVVPDLRGMGLSSHPAGGYDKKTQAGDVAAVLDKLGIQRADLVTHDIGNMVGYAFAAQFPDRVTRWVAMDAPLPGIGNWDKIVLSPLLWHFNFRGPDVERLVQGRERIYLDRFWDELSANPKAIDEATRQHYAAIYARPGAMHSAFEQFAAFSRDASDNKGFVANGKLTMPVLAIGAEKSFGTAMADEVRFVAADVTGVVIPNSGHWLMEEQPAATVAAIAEFLRRPPRAGEPQLRLSPAEVAGYRAWFNRRRNVRAAKHRDDRPAWRSGKARRLHDLAAHSAAHGDPGAHPSRRPRGDRHVGNLVFRLRSPPRPIGTQTPAGGQFLHRTGRRTPFRRTRDEAVTVYITGNGPSDTNYVEAAPKSSEK